MAEEIIETGGEGEKKFTQQEVDNIVASRLARERQGMPSKEELEGYRQYKANQQTEAQKLTDAIKDRDKYKTDAETLSAKVTQYEREKLLKSKGVGEDELEFYAFKIGQMVTDTVSFEQAAETFLKDKQPAKAKVRVEMGVPMEKGAQAKGGNEFMNALIRGAKK